MEEYCERGVNYIPYKEGLNATQVTVADLSPLAITVSKSTLRTEWVRWLKEDIGLKEASLKSS